MRFLNPLMLGWLAAAIVPIVLYLVRYRPRRQEVSTLLFFDALSRQEKDAAWLRRLKRLLSLLLSLLVIAGASAALARLVVAPASDVRSVVVLLDRSASMAAQDASGETRLEAALRAARHRAAGLGGGVALAVVAYDARPEVLLPLTRDRRRLGRALRRVQVRPIAGDPEPALRRAEAIAGIEPPAAIWHFTDAPPPAPPAERAAGPEVQEAREAPSPDASAPAFGEPAAARYEHITLALPEAENAGITALALRRAPMSAGRYEAFVELAGVRRRAGGEPGEEPIEKELRIHVDGRLVGLRRLALSPDGEPSRLLIPALAGEGRRLELAITPPGGEGETSSPGAEAGPRDVLPLDDRAALLIPALEPVRVRWIREAPSSFTELALTALGNRADVAVTAGGPAAWPPEAPVDLAIFQGWLPERWPADLPVVAVNPPRPLGPVQVARLEEGALTVSGPRVTRPRHPLLYGVASDRLELSQSLVLRAEATAGLQPLWIGPAGPLLAAGRLGGRRVVVMGFDPERSPTLPLTTSFPLLMGNAIYWSQRQAGPAQTEPGNRHRTGELIRLPHETLTWTPLSGVPETVPVRGGWLELDRIGTWRSESGGEVRAGSAALLSRRATRLGVAPGAGPRAPAPPAAGAAAGPGESWFHGELTGMLLQLVLALLLLESYLYHRHAVR